MPCVALDELLALGRAPSAKDIKHVLAVVLPSWTKDPRLATVVLGGLARERLPHVAAEVLSCMRAGHVEVNVFTTAPLSRLARKQEIGSWH